MKAYSEYQGSKRTCKNCVYCEWDDGDDSVGIEDFIDCQKDHEGILDLAEEDGSIAKGCPFWEPIEPVKNDSIGTSKTDQIVSFDQQV